MNGKTRDNTPTRFWRCLLLSTGELSLADLLKAAGLKVNAGQEVRFLDVEGEAGQGMGLFERLNGHASAKELADYIDASAKRCYGTAGEAFLQCVANGYSQLRASLAGTVKALARRILPAGASAQAGRVADNFGLLAVTGELATKYGITGWQQGEVATSPPPTLHKSRCR